MRSANRTVSFRSLSRVVGTVTCLIFATSHALAQSVGVELPGAQGPAVAESTGDPMLGYAAYALFAGLSIFLICKSARRAKSD